MDKALEFLRHHLVALAQDHVEHSLCAHNLAGGRNKRRIAGIPAHTGNLLQHIVEAVFLAGVLQLLEQVREHAARHLIQQRIGVHAQHLRA